MKARTVHHWILPQDSARVRAMPEPVSIREGVSSEQAVINCKREPCR
jgi:hypothetical protein